MARDYSKESAWERKAYQIFSFKARKDNGEAEKLKQAMGAGSFGDWVRKHLYADNKNTPPRDESLVTVEVYLPKHLADAADEAGLDLSEILQKELKRQLGIAE